MNVNRQVDCMEEVVDDTAGDHETRIDGSAHDASERVMACGGIKPVVRERRGGQ